MSWMCRLQICSNSVMLSYISNLYPVKWPVSFISFIKERKEKKGGGESVRIITQEICTSVSSCADGLFGLSPLEGC